jgi:tetratricopeptide (TPR) repeat protein
MVQKTKFRNIEQLKQLAINKAIDQVYNRKYLGALSTIKKHFKTEDATSYFFKGWISQLNREHDKAIKFFEKSLTQNPLNIDALTGLVSSYIEIGDYERAHECAEQCILINRKDPRNLVTLATVISKRYRGNVEKQREATSLFSEAFDLVKANPNLTKDYIQLTTDILSGWGASLIDLHEVEQAILVLEVAERLDSLNPLVHKNLASAYSSINELDKAISSCKKAQRSDDPNIVYDAMYQEGMLELMKGNFSRGWRLHETRLHTSQFSSVRSQKTPQWDGKPLEEYESLLIYQEQGIGDTLQFSRYIPLVYAKAKNIDIEVMANHYQKWEDPTEEPKSIRQFLHDNYSPYIRKSFIKGWNSPDYDSYTYIISFMSLPRIFRTSLDNIPETPNFRSNSNMDIPEFDVGIFWQGSKEHRNDKNRSIPSNLVKDFIQEFPTLSFVSLQLDENYEVENLPNVYTYRENIKSIDDTLKIINKCKLVLTVDSMVAHLAGSANKDTYILHAYSPDWRWMLEIKNSPWYPSVTNIRQDKNKNWQKPLLEAKEHLQKVFASKIIVD